MARDESFRGSACAPRTPVRVERRNTKEGVDPLGAVAYEPRDLEITGSDGEVVFSMRGIGFPRWFTDESGRIVAAKYLRKAGVPTPEGHETSLEQAIRRITKTIARDGLKQGIFGDADGADAMKSAEAFEAELAFLLVHQYASFNSPVWFNCGLAAQYGIVGGGGNWAWDDAVGGVVRKDNAYDPPQCSACFIQSVDDDLMAIFELVKNEARLFKYGSGTGSNFSALRGRQEKLAGGGNSSGLMSFLEVFDRAAGSTKSGGTTRRAAKMVCLDMDHPEILDFIRWKSREEDKIRVLVEAGYSNGIEGEAQRTASGQNSNNSVRVTDEFMRAVQANGEWQTRMRTTGKVCETHRAADLWREVAAAAWRCADPGVQFDTTINDWHTCPNSGRINASNPCSEYLFLDDTSCNLSSLNLDKFQVEGVDGETEFNADYFRHAVRVMITAMEILVDGSSYPTEAIARNTHSHRPLGLGYANLGSMLMQFGAPYDSDRGRHIAAIITALMTGEAYAQSARLAAAVGPFDAFEINRDPMVRVIRKHRASLLDVDASMAGFAFVKAFDAAEAAWGEAEQLGIEFGYRNAQATVLAPTGTIAYAMGCDTTGIEPDYSVVRWKSLAGGGGMRQSNRALPRALQRLGYSAGQAGDIMRHVIGHGRLDRAPVLDHAFLAARGMTQADVARVEAAIPGVMDLESAFAPHVLGEDAVRRLGLSDYTDPSSSRLAWAKKFSVLSHWGLTREQVRAASDYAVGHMTVEGAPHLREDHLAVFDCASRCGRGRRCLSAESHVRMMASVQPFLSGAISKTVNIPSEATEDDIRGIYELAWRLRVKCVAVYRDKSKVSQPLSGSSSDHPRLSRESALEAVIERTEPGRIASFLAAPAEHMSFINTTCREALGQPKRERPEYDRALASSAGRQASDSGGYAVRRRLPDRRGGFTQEARIGGHKVFLRTGEYRDGKIGEIFIDMSKAGGAFRTMANCFAIAVSIGLQHGVNPAEYVNSFTFVRFEPSGVVQGDQGGVRFSTSVVDYVARVIGIYYLGMNELAHSLPEAASSAAGASLSRGRAFAEQLMDDGSLHHSQASAVATAIDGHDDRQDEVEHCRCGGMLRRTGTCLTCQACGTSSGGCS